MPRGDLSWAERIPWDDRPQRVGWTEEEEQDYRLWLEAYKRAAEHMAERAVLNRRARKERG
jgi:hypothetical protein